MFENRVTAALPAVRHCSLEAKDSRQVESRERKQAVNTSNDTSMTDLPRRLEQAVRREPLRRRGITWSRTPTWISERPK